MHKYRTITERCITTSNYVLRLMNNEKEVNISPRELLSCAQQSLLTSFPLAFINRSCVVVASKKFSGFNEVGASVHHEAVEEETSMTNENPGCVYAYGWNRINMRMIGIWPERQQTWIGINQVWGWAFFIAIAIWLPQTASIVFLWGNMTEVIAVLMTNIPISLAIIKLIIFRIQRNVLISVIDEMIKDWSVARTSDDREAMMKMAKFSKIISVISIFLAGSMLFTFPVFRIVLAVEDRKSISNETRVSVGYLYPSYFPFDVKSRSHFISIWLGQSIATIAGLVAYSGPDSCVAMMVLHLCGQLATVKIALKNLVDEESSMHRSVYWKRLSTIVKRHEELNCYGELIEATFNGMLLFQMVLCTLTFCFQGFFALTTFVEGVSTDEAYPIAKMVFVVVHALYTILHLFVYCWVGDFLVVESTAISYASYENDWPQLPSSQAQALMMVTYRSRIPLRITAGKFVDFSLELFTSVMKTSMGYLSVLLAMKD